MTCGPFFVAAQTPSLLLGIVTFFHSSLHSHLRRPGLRTPAAFYCNIIPIFLHLMQARTSHFFPFSELS
ncbi:hypothetical protein C8R45DRAFT_1039194 [Mycena sanguinolenta]|nr:hypothetical protein C8R45DRAFT_1039194 [Mycena sanguinolenta]